MNETKQGRPARRCGAMGSADGSVLFAGLGARCAAGGPGPDRRRRRGARSRCSPRRAATTATRRRACAEGQRYAFRLDGGPERPDPCSLWQPEGVHGPSAVVFPESVRLDATGTGRACAARTWSSTSCTSARSPPRGRSTASSPGCRDLRELGVTAVEIMPVGQFPGTPQLGLRRRAPLRGAGQLRRAARPAAARGRLPRRGPRDLPGRRLQPFRPGGELPGRVRPILQRPLQDPVGRRRQLRRARLRRGARLRAGQRPDVAGGVPLRRPAAGRRARHLRPGRAAHPPGDRGGRRRRRLDAGAGRRSSSPRAT